MSWRGCFGGGRRDDYTSSNMAPGWFIDIIYTKVLGFDLMKRRKYSYRHIIGQQQPPARNRQSSRCVSYITHTARQYLIYKPQARWWWWGPGERARAHWATCNIRFLLLHHLLTAEDDRKLYLQKTIFFFFFFFQIYKKGRTRGVKSLMMAKWNESWSGSLLGSPYPRKIISGELGDVEEGEIKKWYVSSLFGWMRTHSDQHVNDPAENPKKWAE